MGRTRLAAAALSTAAIASFAGCDNPKPRPAASQGPARAAAPAAAPGAWTPPPAKVTHDPLPAQPAWVGTVLGKPLRAAFPQNDGDCVGNTDLVDFRYVGATPGVMIEGWGWDQEAKAAVARVVLADKDGQIVGGGETGVPRPDVNERRKDIVSRTTGWKAVTPVTTGVVRAYGVVGAGQDTCPLGEIDLGH